jgi:type I restriction enzyme S subunit
LDEEVGKLKTRGIELRAICEFAKTKSGGTPRRSEKQFWNGKIPWLKSGELNDSFNIIENTEFITEIGLQKSSTSLFTKGTLLMAMYGATAGKLGILGMDACTNQAVCSIQNDKGVYRC